MTCDTWSENEKLELNTIPPLYVYIYIICFMVPEMSRTVQLVSIRGLKIHLVQL